MWILGGLCNKATTKDESANLERSIDGIIEYDIDIKRKTNTEVEGDFTNGSRSVSLSCLDDQPNLVAMLKSTDTAQSV